MSYLVPFFARDEVSENHFCIGTTFSTEKA